MKGAVKRKKWCNDTRGGLFYVAFRGKGGPKSRTMIGEWNRMGEESRSKFASCNCIASHSLLGPGLLSPLLYSPAIASEAKYNTDCVGL